MRPFKTILFDCDNTLVISEDIAFEGCAQLGNEVLAKHGIDKMYTGPELMHDFVGFNFRSLLKGLESKFNFTMSEEEMDSYVDRELGAICENLSARAEPCEGSMEVLEQLEKDNKYHLAIVSSSAMPRVVASVRKTLQDRWFPEGSIFSAASSMPEPSSKPDPAIYLFACEKLGIQPGDAVAVEDSRSGATAAKRAGIPLIGYVGPYYAEEGGQEKAQRMERVLTDECGAICVMHHWSEFFDCLKKVEAI